MTTVYIADQGDDRKDGLTPENAVYSIKAAIKIAIRVGATELDIQRTSLERLKKMASKKKTGCGWRIVTQSVPRQERSSSPQRQDRHDEGEGVQ